MTEEAKELLSKLDHNLNDVIFDLVDENETLEGQVNELREQVARLTENKGEWIAQDIHNCHTNFKCSECGYIHDFMHLYGEPTADYTYCPNCGADMREPKGEKIRCNTCVNSDDEFSGECYECLKGMFDHYEKKRR